jgi:tRNA-Thr(GGU) m(6)t(6)A37 methyltransferase TsaA
MSSAITLVPIGIVRSPIREVRDQVFGGVTARIELDSQRFTPESLRGLDEFSHVEVFFYFHQLRDSEIVSTSRHPQNRAEWPQVGIFAQRARVRPSRMGATVCRLVAVEGLTVSVEDLDAIEGTPVLDLKPWMLVMGPRGAVREPAWARELGAGYWKPSK